MYFDTSGEDTIHNADPLLHMAQTIKHHSDLDRKCARARPWVRGFVEEYQDGKPWGYAIFQDPTIDEDEMDGCMSRIDNLLWSAKDAVFGRAHEEFPHFQWEVLDWPEDEAEGDAQRPIEDNSNGDGGRNGADAEDKATEITEEDDTESEEDENDADIETVRELAKLRTHFRWVRDHARKRRKDHDSLDVDRGGIPRGLVHNVFLVVDQDAIDSIVANSPIADSAWVWAIDPEYTGDVDLMKGNGLKEEYYGYMRVRVQQLVNNFWDARHCHEVDLPLPVLWEAAKQSQNSAFVSIDPEEAGMFKADMNLGSALRA